MSGIFRTPSDGYADVPLLAGEQVIRRQTASVGAPSMWGGQLVVTNQRILFRPVDVKGLAELLTEGVSLLPDGLADLGKLVPKVLDYASAYQDGLAGALPTASITGVRAGRDPQMTAPPSLILGLDTGSTVELGILTSIRTPSIWPGNRTARDDTIELIDALLAQSHQG